MPPSPLLSTCFCGSSQPYAACCRVFLESQADAETAQALMRSRYTAYVLGDEKYLLQTWAPATCPQILDLAINQVKWLGLEIHTCRKGLMLDNEGEVEFSVTYVAAGCVCTLHENSRFVRLERKWYYLDGKCDISRKKIERNSPCPCNSGRKFKQCCLS